MKNIFYFFLIISSVALMQACSKDSPSSTGGTNASGKGGSLARFTIINNYLYAINSNKLLVFDVTNAALPVLKNTVTVGDNIETIYPFRNKLFIASTTGMFMYDVSNPTNPTQESFVQHLTGCDPVVANSKYAYLTIHSGTTCRGDINELQVYDIQNDVSNNIFVKSIPMQNPIGLGLYNNYLFVCDKGNGLIVMDITDGANPKQIKKISDENFIDVIPYNNMLICMLVDGIAYYDISDMNNIVKLSALK